MEFEGQEKMANTANWCGKLRGSKRAKNEIGMTKKTTIPMAKQANDGDFHDVTTGDNSYE